MIWPAGSSIISALHCESNAFNYLLHISVSLKDIISFQMVFDLIYVSRSACENPVFWLVLSPKYQRRGKYVRGGVIARRIAGSG